MTHEATYSPEDNKLRLYPGERLELPEDTFKGEATKVKAAICVFDN